MILTFESMDETRKCDHPYESFCKCDDHMKVVHSCGIVYYALLYGGECFTGN